MYKWRDTLGPLLSRTLSLLACYIAQMGPTLKVLQLQPAMYNIYYVQVDICFKFGQGQSIPTLPVLSLFHYTKHSSRDRPSYHSKHEMK